MALAPKTLLQEVEEAAGALAQPLDVAVARAEARRIVGLGKRQPAVDLTAMFKTPRGTMKLRPVQSAALAEIMHHGALFGPIGVGFGKTLISLLAGPAMRLSRSLASPPRPGRTVILVPSSLRQKTIDEMYEVYAPHWKIDDVAVISYDTLSGTANSDLLDRHAPDLIICDEAHKLAGDSARGRRFFRYLRQNPHVRVIPLSGSFTRDSLKEYYKLVNAALHHMSPLPLDYPVFRAWDAVISTKDYFKEAERAGVIPFLNLVTRDHHNAVEMLDFRAVARREFANRTDNVAGWVTAEGASAEVKLQFSAINIDIPFDIAAALYDVEKNWRRPDGEEFEDALSKHRYMWQLFQGYFQYWDWSKWPDGQPDQEWMAYRAAYHKQLRAFLKDPRLAIVNRDSPMNIARAIRAGEIVRPVELLQAYDNWQKVKDRPAPPTKTRWMSDHMVEAIRAYIKKHNEPTLIWVDSPLLRDKLGKYFTVYEPGVKPNEKRVETCVLTVSSHNAGLNLQGWRRNLLTKMPGSNTTLQQLIGRTWRAGQERLVQADYFTSDSAPFIEGVVDSLHRQAQYTFETTRQTQAVLEATWR